MYSNELSFYILQPANSYKHLENHCKLLVIRLLSAYFLVTIMLCNWHLVNMTNNF